jgi:hypothetical protein
MCNVFDLKFVNVSVVSCNTIVPEAFGKLIVLSDVGLMTPNVVSKSSGVEPSKVNEFVISIVVELTVVVVPLTVKLPVIVVLPETVKLSSTAIVPPAESNVKFPDDVSISLLPVTPT